MFDKVNCIVCTSLCSIRQFGERTGPIQTELFSEFAKYKVSRIIGTRLCSINIRDFEKNQFRECAKCDVDAKTQVVLPVQSTAESCARDWRLDSPPNFTFRQGVFVSATLAKRLHFQAGSSKQLLNPVSDFAVTGCQPVVGDSSGNGIEL
jgi:hypothetical protein